jgi:hypothetical protein
MRSTINIPVPLKEYLYIHGPPQHYYNNAIHILNRIIEILGLSITFDISYTHPQHESLHYHELFIDNDQFQHYDHYYTDAHTSKYITYSIAIDALYHRSRAFVRDLRKFPRISKVRFHSDNPWSHSMLNAMLETYRDTDMFYPFCGFQMYFSSNNEARYLTMAFANIYGDVHAVWIDTHNIQSPQIKTLFNDINLSMYGFELDTTLQWLIRHRISHNSIIDLQTTEPITPPRKHRSLTTLLAHVNQLFYDDKHGSLRAPLQVPYWEWPHKRRRRAVRPAIAILSIALYDEDLREHHQFPAILAHNNRTFL